MTSLHLQSEPTFLRDVLIVDVDDHGAPTTTHNPVADRAVAATLAGGLPGLQVSEEDSSVALAVPIYRDGQIVSIVIFVGCASGENVGVMEIWQPIGEYDELSLTGGYFGALDRFQNVSSFVRFEKGSGLPGQVWRNLSFIVHDNLSRHPGFLRAAGASAEALQVAFGIPILSDQFLASVLLISSDVAPIAKGYEVWRSTGDDFVLETSAYQHLPDPLRLELEMRLPKEGSMPGAALRAGGAVLIDDPEVVMAGRGVVDSYEARGLAIPFFEGDRLTNVLTLLL